MWIYSMAEKLAVRGAYKDLASQANSTLVVDEPHDIFLLEKEPRYERLHSVCLIDEKSGSSCSLNG